MTEQIADQITAAKTKEEVLDILVKGLTEDLTASATAVFWIDQENGKIFGGAAWPEELEKMIRKVVVSMDDRSSVMASMLRTNSPLVVDDAVNDPRGKKWLVALFKAKSFVIAPIVTDKKVIGIVGVGEIENTRHFTSREVEKIQYLASKTGAAMERLELQI